MDLKKIRKALDMSQYELAKLSGVSRDKITRVECGYAELTEEEKTAIKGASHGNRNKKKQSK